MFDFENKNKNNSPFTGPFSTCEPEKESILKSIAYYNGNYKKQPGDKIIPRKYLDFLRKKANI